jgi:alpha-amylase/alpha-mannosidase (GH57 family)
VSNIERGFFCVYGHFSQPPRGNPLTGEIGQEDEAAPYINWNERIADRCYEPNAKAENYKRISFSFSESLLAWLQTHKPEIYRAVIDADSAQDTDSPQGNALATAYHHSILPLARRRDKRTQIRWGMAAFEHRFGRKPLGFWLPEMAVDTETLTLLAEAGLQYTLLAAQQIRDLPANGGAGPYHVQVSRNQRMAVFVRDDRLSTELSFKVHTLGGAGHWAHNVLGPARKTSGPLLLLATEGETFGHHYMGEDQFLHWLMTREAQAVGYTVTNLDRFFATHPPRLSVSIQEPSSWSDQRGLANWATGQANAQRDTTWKGALRRALDNVANELDRAYEDLLRPMNVDPWQLRDKYAPVLLKAISAEEFVKIHLPDIGAETAEALQALLHAQELAQRMYTSATFTNDDLESRQPRYAIACAAAALMLAQRATGRYMADRLLSDLAVVTSKGNSITGMNLLWQMVEEYQLELTE